MTISVKDLDVDLVEEFLIYADPVDVAHFAQTSRAFERLVYHPPDDHLWRSLYLAQPLDDPRGCVSQTGQPRPLVRWRPELQRIIRARNVLLTPGRFEALTREEQCVILGTLLDLVYYIPPTEPYSLPNVSLSLNLAWVTVHVRRSNLLTTSLLPEPTFTTLDPRPEDDRDELVQLTSRLHTYFGLVKSDFDPRRRQSSRAYTYMFRRYKACNRYGPYRSDMVLNWVHLRALHHLISLHVLGVEEEDRVAENFDYLVYALSMSFTQVVGGVQEDWAGVTGTWQISFCFIDHRRLMDYNRLDATEETPLDVSIFTDSDFGEVFRTLQVDLRITGTKPNPTYPHRPTLEFSGTVHTNYIMTGFVEMTSEPNRSSQTEWGSGRMDDVVRWHFASGELDRPVWSSEGVQVGGLRSRFGILGAWTTVFHDEDDPVGPFWMRRIPT